MQLAKSVERNGSKVWQGVLVLALAVALWPNLTLADGRVAPPVPNRNRELPSRAVQAGALTSLLHAPEAQISALTLRRIGPDVADLLVEYATAAGQDMQVRLRSLAWLQYFPGPQAKAVLLETLRAQETPVSARRVCLRALALAFGSEMVPTVRDSLQDRNVFIREAAALALGDIDDRRVPDILTDHLQREQQLAVRDAIMGSLRKLAERHANP